MTDNVMRRLILARAMAVEPIARALCPDVPVIPGDPGQPFSRSTGRWRTTATHAAWSACDATNLPYGLPREQVDGGQRSRSLDGATEQTSDDGRGYGEGRRLAID